MLTAKMLEDLKQFVRKYSLGVKELHAKVDTLELILIPYDYEEEG